VARPGSTQKKEKEKEKEKLRFVGPLVGPTHIFYNIFNYDNIIILYIKKKSQKGISK
jgi:hypothetical protein